MVKTVFLNSFEYLSIVTFHKIVNYRMNFLSRPRRHTWRTRLIQMLSIHEWFDAN